MFAAVILTPIQSDELKHTTWQITTNIGDVRETQHPL